MVERGQGPELEQDILKSIYKDFEYLANKYGNQPLEGMDMPTDGRTLKVELSNESNLHGHPDFISGRYFGLDAGLVETFYRKNDNAYQLSLLKDLAGNVSVRQFVSFEVMHIKESYSLQRLSEDVPKLNIDLLRDLLNSAEEVLTGEKPGFVVSKKVSQKDSARLEKSRKEQAKALGAYYARRLEAEDRERRKQSKK